MNKYAIISFQPAFNLLVELEPEPLKVSSEMLEVLPILENNYYKIKRIVLKDTHDDVIKVKKDDIADWDIRKTDPKIKSERECMVEYCYDIDKTFDLKKHKTILNGTMVDFGRILLKDGNAKFASNCKIVGSIIFYSYFSTSIIDLESDNDALLWYEITGSLFDKKSTETNMRYFLNSKIQVELNKEYLKPKFLGWLERKDE